MTSLLYSIIVAALLSTTSLVAVLLRVSPLLSPVQALPAFFLSLFLSIASIMTIAFYFFWKYVPIHAWDEGKILGIALRQGLFVAAATVITLLFFLVGILTWWIGVLIYAVFILIEVALQH
ncbi:MAG TPA: hypothetical protein VHA78_05810 [Candidatus Peribacteraceae bacterium]|nr:hypothetical protein [Candidatus Peribacteraceae bacterium]